MLHLIFCPNCGENVRVRCDNVPNPFQRIHADHITQLLRSTAEKPLTVPVTTHTASVLKLMFLLDMIGEQLPEIDELPKMPPLVEGYINFADAETIKHVLIQAVGRWDELGEAKQRG